MRKLSTVLMTLIFTLMANMLVLSLNPPLLSKDYFPAGRYANLGKSLPPLMTQNFTIDMWVNPGETQPTYANILDFNHRANVGMVFQQDGNNINNFVFGLGNGSTSSVIIYQLQANVWQHVAFEREGTTLRLYVNGNLVSTAGCFAEDIYYLPDSAVTVQYNINYGRYFNGAIKGLKFWNYAKSATNIIADSMNLTSFDFNGSTDGVILGNGIAPEIAKDFSLQMRVKPAATQQTYANIIDFNHRGNIGLVVQQNENNVNNFVFGIGNGSTSSYIVCTLTADVWQNVKFERIGTTLNLYVDSVLVGTTPCFAEDIYFLPNSNITVGYNINFGRYFNGSISDVRLSSTPVEIGHKPGAIWFEDKATTVLNNTAFTSKILANTGSFKLGACSIQIFYDPNMLSVDTTIGINGITKIGEGDSMTVNSSTPGKISMVIWNPSGKEPSAYLQLFYINWIAKTTGTSIISCNVTSCVDINTLTIGLPVGYSTKLRVL